MSVVFYADGQLHAGSARGFYVVRSGRKCVVPISGAFTTERAAVAAMWKLERGIRPSINE